MNDLFENAVFFIIGVAVALYIVGTSNDFVSINGIKSGHMTVDYKDKTYDLVEKK